MTIIDTLSDHIASNYLYGDGTDLTPDTPLLELNILDSAAMLSLVHYVQTEFGVSISFDEIVPTNFGSIRAIAQLIERVRAPAPGHSVPIGDAP